MLESKELTKVFGSKTAVDHVNLKLEKGHVCAMLGPNGSGKTTWMKMAAGLIKPTSGKIYIDGQDIYDKSVKMRDIRFKVGLVFQYPEYQIFEETVYKDVSFGPKNMGLSEQEIDERVR